MPWQNNWQGGWKNDKWNEGDGDKVDDKEKSWKKQPKEEGWDECWEFKTKGYCTNKECTWRHGDQPPQYIPRKWAPPPPPLPGLQPFYGDEEQPFAGESWDAGPMWAMSKGKGKPPGKGAPPGKGGSPDMGKGAKGVFLLPSQDSWFAPQPEEQVIKGFEKGQSSRKGKDAEGKGERNGKGKGRGGKKGSQEEMDWYGDGGYESSWNAKGSGKPGKGYAVPWSGGEESSKRSNAKEERDEAKEEVLAEIDTYIAMPETVLKKSDFDFRVRKLLFGLHGRGGMAKVKEALECVHTYTSQKEREGVKNWPAYVLTLLKNFAPDAEGPPAGKGKKEKSDGEDKESREKVSIWQCSFC
eukprot:gnl/MRDRNA2_/MRDRNA2_18479_c0_seq1.p1 gnl/MRDRNA2_/MRDRNA2_18479_c0~~gnl/MRDRNA2_/MRDRNA2_18479_c0_seq1.p1  ORF type:complete len:354 (+),score=92.02 gnl/MRDRNA2_/MRDRNA2_18479_c0_seq1:83-1144(+)